MTTIELDTFSGRPNPVWTLTSDETEAFARLIVNLSAADPPSEAALGYRGFIITGDGLTDGAIDRVRVFAGTVAVSDRQFKDSNGAERWLFENARSHGLGQLIDGIEAR